MWQRHIKKIKLLKEDQIVQLVFSDVSETQEKKKKRTIHKNTNVPDAFNLISRHCACVAHNNTL